MADDYIGRQFGNYQLLRLIGKGSFAAVYLAEHRYLEVPAAIKLLHVEMNPVAYANFHHEARTIAHLQHAHIVRVTDFGIEDQTPYLAMEYMPYGTLRTLYPKQTRVPLDQVVAYAKQIAPALDYAHQQQVIHRDIKPENILLNARNEAVLSDFGIALAQETLNSTVAQQPAGTPLYMAPEQIARTPCAASDQYALSVLIYEWLAGELPFQGSLFEVLSQHMHRPPPSLCARMPQLPRQVEAVVFKALSKNPRDRFANVQDFATLLEKACFAQSPQSFSLPTVPNPTVYTTLPVQAAGIQVQTATVLQPPPVTPPYVATRAVAEPPPTTTPASTQKEGSLSQSSLTQANRRRLLRRVRAFWVEGVLQHSLHGAALIALGLQEQPDAIASPWSLALQAPAVAPRSLSTGTRITQIYDATEGELLILGAPGSGKTTLLLELARDLLERAERDEAQPIPVVFNLSSWALKRQRLTDWLVEELLSKYQVPRKLGRALVSSEHILPLLDGLDEVAPKERIACIGAINSYRQEHGLVPMVVCCRHVDYLELNTRLRLDNAVVVQPLTERQIDDYLRSGGEPLRALWLALHQDAELRGLAHTPLMLSILTLTYHGMPVEQLLQPSSPGGRQRQVFERYVERMLTGKESDPRYTQQKTIHWLSQLAQRLVQRNQTVFYIERMQPDWLKERWALRRYPFLAAGLVFGLFGFFIPGPMSSFLLFLALDSTIKSSKSSLESTLLLGASLLTWFLATLLFGLLNGLTYGWERKPRVRKKWSWRRIGGRIIRSTLNGLFTGLSLGIPLGLFINTVVKDLDPNLLLLGIVLTTGVMSGPLFFLIDGLLGIQITEIRPTETFAWSWRRMARNFVKFVGLALLILLPLVLVSNLIIALYGEIITNWTASILSLLSDVVQGDWSFMQQIGWFCLLISGLIGALTGGLSSDVLAERNLTKPNQGIRRSVRHSVLLGSAGVVVGGIASGLVTYVALPAHNLVGSSVFAFFFGPLLGLIIGLRVGGVAFLQHFALRWLLWKTRTIPWNYSRFLDYAARHVLLRKVGGGYIFVHRLLLEYFASLAPPDSSKK